MSSSHSIEYRGYKISVTDQPLYIVETGSKGSACFLHIEDAKDFIDNRVNSPYPTKGD